MQLRVSSKTGADSTLINLGLSNIWTTILQIKK